MQVYLRFSSYQQHTLSALNQDAHLITDVLLGNQDNKRCEFLTERCAA